MFYSQLSQVFLYSGTLSNRPPSGTLLLRRLHRMREIFKSGSVRGVEALSYGRILWHSSIEREEQQGIQSMPKWKCHITSTRLSVAHSYSQDYGFITDYFCEIMHELWRVDVLSAICKRFELVDFSKTTQGTSFPIANIFATRILSWTSSSRYTCVVSTFVWPSKTLAASLPKIERTLVAVVRRRS